MTPKLRGALASAGFVAVLVGAGDPVNAGQGSATALPLLQQQHAHARLPAAPAGELTTAEHRAMMTRLATMDARIDMLTAQMNAFTGEMKVEAMASVVTALVERQRMIRDELAQLRGPMTPRQTPGNTSTRVPPEVDLDALCLPEGVSPHR